MSCNPTVLRPTSRSLRPTALIVSGLGRILFGLGFGFAALGALPFDDRVRAQETPNQPTQRDNGNFVGLAQAPEANLFVGSATTRIPIEVPPGRKQLTPTLALVYSSSGGPSAYGYGWDLPIGKIQRSASHGMLTCANLEYSDEFVLMLPAGNVEFSSDGAGGWAPRIQESFFRIELDESANVWHVWDRSGLHYEFGTSNAARMGNNLSAPIRLDLTCNGPDHGDFVPGATHAWMLSSIEDPNGNRVDFSYFKAGGSSPFVVSYLDAIHYGGNPGAGLGHQFKIDLFWMDRPADDQISVSMGGFEAPLTKRIDKIEIRYPISGPRVRWYDFQYDAEVAAPRLGRQSFLNAVTVYNEENEALARWDGEPASSSFLYKEHDPASGRFGTWTADQRTSFSPEGSSGFRLMEAGHTIRDVFDINGDGFPDIVQPRPWWQDDCTSTQAGVWDVYLGSKAGFSSVPKQWAVPNKQVMCSIRDDETEINDHWTETDTLDINGDGIYDFVDSTPGPFGIWNVYLGYRSTASGVAGGFQSATSWQAPIARLRKSVSSINRFDFENGTMETRDMIDMNADGLLDLVDTAYTGSDDAWYVWLNEGDRFANSPLALDAPHDFISYSKEENQILATRDMNGDGLPEQVLAWDKGQNPAGFPGFWRVYVNTGNRIAELPASRINGRSQRRSFLPAGACASRPARGRSAT